MIPKSGGVTVRDTETTLAQTWAEMEKLLDSGKVKNIGLSNFTKSEVEEVLRTAKHKPDVIQLELHPYLQQADYVKWLQSQGIEVTAYSPFGNVSFCHSSSAVTVVPRWLRQGSTHLSAKSHLWRWRLGPRQPYHCRDC